MNENYEMSFGLILHAGDSKSKSLMAIEAAREADFEQALNLIKEAEEDLHIAHQMQTELIQGAAKGEKIDIDILLVHAQDHLTTAMVMIDQAKEFYHIYSILHKLMKEEK